MVTFAINIPPMLAYIYQHHGSYGSVTRNCPLKRRWKHRASQREMEKWRWGEIHGLKEAEQLVKGTTTKTTSGDKGCLRSKTWVSGCQWRSQPLCQFACSTPLNGCSCGQELHQYVNNISVFMDPRYFPIPQWLYILWSKNFQRFQQIPTDPFPLKVKAPPETMV